MIIRIDLLDASERRQQGPISSRFFIRIVAATLMTLLVIAGVVAFTNGLDTRNALQRGRDRWKEIEPRYQSALRIRERNAEVRRYLEELDDWAAARIAWHTVLDPLQRIAPAEIQFTRMEIRDDIAAPRPRPDGDPVQPYRLARVRINGRTVGPRADDRVSRFITDVKELGAPDPLFLAVALLSIQAEPTLGENISSFEIDATGAERPLKSP